MLAPCGAAESGRMPAWPGRHPGRAGLRGPRGHGRRREQVDGLVEHGVVVQVRIVQRVVCVRRRVLCCRAVGVGAGLVPEDQRDIDRADPEHPQRVGRLGLNQRDVGRGLIRAQFRCRCSREGAERGPEGREPDSLLPQADVRGQFGLGGVEAAEDLLGALGEQAARVGEPDPAAGSLHQLRARFRLQPGHVMADRRLSVVERLRRGGHRTVPGDSDEHPEPGGIQHALNYRSNRILAAESSTWPWRGFACGADVHLRYSVLLSTGS